MQIIIVEDEIKTLKGIEKLCTELGEEYEVVGKARNGQEGIELIRKWKPDVVLTDVSMPIKSGLEMIQDLVLEGCRSKFIILSGFADFQYAQEAIKLGSIDYLLKPITRDALFKTLQHTKDLLENEAEVIDLKKYEKEELLSRTIVAKEMHSLELLRELEKRIGDREQWGICLLKSDVRIRTSDWENIQRIIKKECAKKEYAICCSENKKEGVLVFQTESKECAMEFLNTIKGRIEREVPAELVFSFSQMKQGDDFHAVLQKTEEQSNWYISSKENRILEEEIVGTFLCNKLVYPTNIERKIIEKIYSGKIQNIHEEVEEFMGYLTEKTYHYKEVREAILCMTVSVLYAIRQSCYGVYDEINHLNVLEWMKDKISLLGIQNMLINMIGELERYQSTIRSASHPLVSKALKIIDHDFKRDISVDEIAGLLHITPEYLCSLFTKELGIKFTVYCTQKRINFAKELFRNQEIKVYEAAASCGYLDVKYFCKVFKKYTGKSPSDYQHSFHV